MHGFLNLFLLLIPGCTHHLLEYFPIISFDIIRDSFPGRQNLEAGSCAVSTRIFSVGTKLSCLVLE
jgi:hypothetical protein